MRSASSLLRLAAGAALCPLLLGCPAAKDPAETETKAPSLAATGPYPAAEGFNAAASDPKAVAIADRVMQEMGGYAAWQNARYFGWGFFGNQYQIWDKQTNDYHWEQDTLVANYNLGTKQGQVYSRGQDISATPTGQKLLEGMPARWNNNSWWLLMPFKLKDSGVTLTYQGTTKTMADQPADELRLTFENVGSTPQNRYEILVSPSTGLVDEWAYFPQATDTVPAFRRRWADYTRYGQLLLASDRSEAEKPAKIDNIGVAQTVPEGTMSSKVPVTKL